MSGAVFSCLKKSIGFQTDPKKLGCFFMYIVHFFNNTNVQTKLVLNQITLKSLCISENVQTGLTPFSTSNDLGG